jgi:UDP-N-acetylmuramoyl-L-alanyl-D-glutamate--2,6-diaminopimelate ligase
MREMRLAGVRYLAMEVSSQALYMNRVYGIKFDACVYTNLSLDHIGGNEHPTFEHYMECKRTLFSDYGADVIIYNADDSHADKMLSAVPKGSKKLGYALHRESDIKAERIHQFKESDKLGVSFDFVIDKERFETKIAFPGSFSVYNALAAIAVCRECGLDLNKIASVISDVQIKGRFETVQALPYATFIIDYAHNEVSLTSALETLRAYNPKRIVCLFGSVGGRTKGRRAELGSVAARLADFSILTADNPDFESPDSVIRDIETQFAGKDNYIKIPDRKKAIEYAVSIAREGDIFLFAGKGHENYQLIQGEKVPFSEKEILLSACQSLSPRG